MQLTGHEDKLPGQLSGGQQQRVAIARAIVIEPPLLLMDEPLSNLDAKLRLEMRAEIRRIHRELGRTTIYVTHDQDEALSLADRIVVMKDGLVQQVAAPEEVYAQPANLHVARFMGYRNVITLKAGARNGERVILEGQGLGSKAPRNRIFRPAGHGRDPSGGYFHRRAARMRSTARSRTSNTAAMTRLSMCAPATTSLLHVRTATRVQAGDAVTLTIAPERVLVYPAESAA